MKIKNSFLKKTSIYFIGTLSTKMISVLLVPIYAYFVAVNDLSEYDYISTIASTLTPVVFAAIWEAVLKFCIKKDENTDSIISTVVFFSIGMTIVCLIVYSIIGFFAGFNFSLLFVIIFIIVQGMTTIWQFAGRAMHENKRYVVAAIVGSVALIFMDCVLIFLHSLDYFGLSLSYFISQLSILVVLEAKLHLLSKFKIKLVSKKVLKTLLAFSLPLVINNVSLWLYSSGSRIIIKNFIGVTENGLYAFASKFSILISLISTVISMAIIEEAYSYNTIEEYCTKMSSLVSIISKAYFSLINLALPAIYILYSIAFVHTDYYASRDYIFLLLLAALFTALSNNFGSAFQVTNNTKYIFLTTITGASVALGVSLVLLKVVGVYGALFGSAFGPFVMMLTRAIYAKKTTGLTIKWESNIRILIIGIAVDLVLIKFNNIWIQIVLFSIMIVYLSFEFRLEFRQIYKKLNEKRRTTE